MANQINRYNLQDAFIRQADRIQSTTKTNLQNQEPLKNVDRKSFQQILDNQLANSISFSKHAVARTEQRNIDISQSDLVKLGSACEKAGQKGIKDALIVMNDSAFIVNTPNKVVVTVVDKNDINNNIFTNIDGALFI